MHSKIIKQKSKAHAKWFASAMKAMGKSKFNLKEIEYIYSVAMQHGMKHGADKNAKRKTKNKS